MKIQGHGISGLVVVLKRPAAYWTGVLEIDQVRRVEHPSFGIPIPEEYNGLTANAFVNPLIGMEDPNALRDHLCDVEAGFERESGFRGSKFDKLM